MINNLALIKKVLAFIYQNEEIILDEAVLKCIGGFNLLAERGLIKIEQIGDKYVTTLTFKGLKFLLS
jgi:hypothetical protein